MAAPIYFQNGTKPYRQKVLCGKLLKNLNKICGFGFYLYLCNPFEREVRTKRLNPSS